MGCERRERDDHDVYPSQKPERDGKRQVNGWPRLNQKWKEARMKLTRKRARHANRCVKVICTAAGRGDSERKVGSGWCTDGPAVGAARKSDAPTLRRARSAGFGSDLHPPILGDITNACRWRCDVQPDHRNTAWSTQGPPEVPGPDVPSP